MSDAIGRDAAGRDAQLPAVISKADAKPTVQERS
jgi:hypothetical protein